MVTGIVVVTYSGDSMTTRRMPTWITTILLVTPQFLLMALTATEGEGVLRSGSEWCTGRTTKTNEKVFESGRMAMVNLTVQKSRQLSQQTLCGGVSTSHRFQDIDKRVEHGRTVEKLIFENLVKCGLKLRPPSSREDIRDKIDGWWYREGSRDEEPIQIKYRETGDDVLFEVVKDCKWQIPGRDMVGKAVYYAVLDRAGRRIVVVSVDEAKKLIDEVMKVAQAEGFDDHGNFRMRGVTLRIRPDPNSGQEKVMAYIPISLLKQVIPPCQAELAVEKLTGS